VRHDTGIGENEKRQMIWMDHITIKTFSEPDSSRSRSDGAKIQRSRKQLRRKRVHMITDELKRQFAELSMECLETLQRDGDDRNLNPIMDQWEALEEKVGRVVCYGEIIGWLTGIRFEQPVTLH
jgi:hypothetical protein